MSTKTFDPAFEVAPRSETVGFATRLFGPLVRTWEQLERAREVSFLVDKGMDASEAFQKVYGDKGKRSS